MILQAHLQSGLTFLQNSQLDNGSWLVELTKVHNHAEKELRDNVFSAALLVREISAFAADNPLVDRACTFLREHQRSNGLWNFYKKGDMRLMPCDFDTTSCVAAALLLAKQPFDLQPILTQLQQHQHPEGGYWTFAMPPTRFGVNPIVNNFRDHIIQAHIFMFLLLARVDYESQLHYLLDILRSRDYESPQPSYDSALLFLTMFARALCYLDNPPPHLQTEITQHLIDQANKHPLNSLELACLIRGLLACHYQDELESWVQQLIAQQAEDGGWPSQTFYNSYVHHYGSRPITTSMALNALAAYMERSPA